MPFGYCALELRTRVRAGVALHSGAPRPGTVQLPSPPWQHSLGRATAPSLLPHRLLASSPPVTPLLASSARIQRSPSPGTHPASSQVHRSQRSSLRVRHLSESVVAYD